jgi:hypothetical protein
LPTSIAPLRKIPGEAISWLKQRKEGYLYADKSVYLERLLENEEGNTFFFLTRPRRFGKSSFLTMAKYFFDGNKTLFDGLQIGDRGNADFFKNPGDGGVPEELKDETWIRCPAIYLDFHEIDFDTKAEFKRSYTQKLRNIVRSYGLEYLERESVIDISDLITELKFKFKLEVVVLVDEYDSPFHNALVKKKDRALAEEIRCFLDDLFGSIKSKIEELRLVLILGIARLALTSLESGPNNYVDLTYKEEFAGVCGFTSEEIKGFHPEIAHQFNLNSKEGINKFLGKLREEYDGYNFTFQYSNGKKKNVLNPVSTMKCLGNKKFGCYWSATSNVNEIIRRLYFSKEPLQAFKHSKLARNDIEEKRNPAMESIPLEILMLLYGYFTIESYNEKTEEVVLNFPNNEIRNALQRNIDKYDPDKDVFLSEEHGWLYELKWHMKTGRLEGMMNTLTMFDIPFSKTLRQGTNEFISNTAWLIDKLVMAGIRCRESVVFMKEKNTAERAGDVDVLTLYLKKNYILSIKYGHSATTAIQQLIDYLQEYQTTFLEAINEPDEAWFVGINFNSRTGGTLHEWIAIPLEKVNLHIQLNTLGLHKIYHLIVRVQ